MINAYGQPMWQRLISLNVDKEVITNRNPLGSQAVHQAAGDLLRQAREKCTGFQGLFAWKVF